MTNNLSDQHWRSIKSPWIFAHRIGHTLIAGYKNKSGHEIVARVKDFTYKLMKKAYGYKWPDNVYFNGHSFFT